MKILYLIGNGFDLHVGLDTSYQSFLKYYLAQPVPDALDDIGKRYIARLKADIQDNIQLWSDFELQYGKHMRMLGTMDKAVHTLEEELDIINDDVREKMSAFISNENSKVGFSDEARTKFLADVIKPEMHIRDFERNTIGSMRANSWNGTANVVDFITFNYTNTLEALVRSNIATSGSFEIHEPVHVHGYYDRRMIMGVNDLKQIENEELRKLTYAADALVKPNNNHAYGVTHTNRCETLINDAQLICCYGLSYGDTDKLWWQRICNTLLQHNGVYVILFEYVKDLPSYANHGHKLQHLMRQHADHFLIQGGIDEFKRQQLANRVYVSINDSLFDIRIELGNLVVDLPSSSAVTEKIIGQKEK